jgi:hypothetical protein
MIKDQITRDDRERDYNRRNPPERTVMRHPYWKGFAKRRIPARPPHPMAGVSEHRQKLIRRQEIIRANQRIGPRRMRF